MVYEYDRVVIGSDLNAVIYAFAEEVPLLYTSPRPPLRFDFLDSKLDLSFLKLPNKNRTLSTFNTKLSVGSQKRLLWERLLFLLSLRGHLPLSNLCKNMRHIGGTIICSNEYSKIMEIKFKNCVFFGDSNVRGFVQKTKFDLETYLCYDYIAFNSGGKHNVDFIHTDDDFVSEIWFYGSDRIDGNTPVRDACSVSKLTEEQLLDFDYSETMARFKTVKIMKDNGMRGKLNGYTKTGTPRHYDFRTSSIRREIRSLENNIAPAADCIEVKKNDESSMLELLKSGAHAYDRILGFFDENTS